MRVIFKFKIIVIIIFLPVCLFAQSKQTVVMNTPTAFTIAKGSYKISFLGYDNGGMEFKTYLGLHNILFLGASLDVQSAIGRDKPEFNVPGVIGKLKIADGGRKLPIAVAIGYDSFFVGYDGVKENNENELDRVIYGPYLVFTGSIFLFDSEQYVNVGIRTPTQPHYTPDKTSYFLSLDIPLGEFFRFEAGIERLYWNFKDHEEWLYSAGLKYVYNNIIGIEFAVIMQEHMRPNRVVRFEYHGVF
jgi:uncharacterized membrane protein YciS (DUF1049 family)